MSLAATAALRATVTTDFFQGRRAAVWLGFIDDAGAVVPAPAPIVGGFMEGADFDDDPPPGRASACASRTACAT